LPELTVLRVFTGEGGRFGNPLGVFTDGGSVPAAERQTVAADLGFSETVFVDDAERGEIAIYTPSVELPFAGHPTVGTAWLLAENGTAPDVLRPPAGEVGVRRDGELTYVDADPAWSPGFEYIEHGSPAEVDALTGAPEGVGEAYCWAWIDEAAGLVRARSFVPDAGVIEDEATGSAALALSARLGKAIEVRQGRGSVLHARPLSPDRAEVGGRTVLDEARPYP
jgi:predicted PhzF superfamily epimerase YddE/YHI9